ncbi:MAG: right-handed parallel beta-helix repeat-containing protein [Bryobacterales bacterium]|nr:right-handed parallel beta-helix repeat-containing protein [Bryobacterales bacterium]
MAVMTRLVVVLLIMPVLPAADLTLSTGGPLRTLEAARDKAREIHRSRPAEMVTIHIESGTYQIDNTLVLTAADSNVAWVAAPGAQVVISGGQKIDGWTKSGAGEWKARMPGADFRQLFIDGRRAVRARTPNEGYLRLAGKPVARPKIRLQYRGEDVKREWLNGPAEMMVLMNWFYLRMPMTAMDQATHTVTLAGAGNDNVNEAEARYWVENVRNALDAPGEWFLDRDSGEVFYRPLGDEDPTRMRAVAGRLLQLLRIEGRPELGQLVRNLSFRNLIFAYSDWSMPPEGVADVQAAIGTAAAIEATGAQECSFEHCRFEHLGGYAILLGRGAKRNRVRACEFADLGGGGVRVGETAGRQNVLEQNSENVISDNEMHGLGRVAPSAVGVWIGNSSADEVSHNHIHDLSYTAISVGWTWGYKPSQCRGHRIEYNHLHDIGQRRLSDMGAIYTLGIQPGTVIRNNLIHDVTSFRYGGFGIYPDEGSSEIVIENNIVYGCSSAGFDQHYGRENTIRNNIFAFNHEYQLMRSRAEDHLSFRFEGNIVQFDDGRLLGSNWSGNGIRMDRNIYWDERGGVPGFAGWTWEQWRARGLDTRSKIADPLFRNAANGDFRLLDGSPALAMGFQQIDMSTTGPRTRPGLEP